MGSGQSEISREDEWEAEDCTCVACGVSVCGLPTCTHLFKDIPDKKTYAFYERAASRTSITIGSSFGGNVGANKDGPSAGFSSSGSQSVTTNEGDYMVKFLRKDRDGHRCIACFYKTYPTIFKSIALTIKGRGWLINSDLTLHPASYGDIEVW